MAQKFTVTIAVLVLTFSVLHAETRHSVPLGDSPQRGPANAPVTIIEFLDFQ